MSVGSRKRLKKAASSASSSPRPDVASARTEKIGTTGERLLELGRALEALSREIKQASDLRVMPVMGKGAVPSFPLPTGARRTGRSGYCRGAARVPGGLDA